MNQSKTVNIRVLETRSEDKDKIVRVALVTDIEDSYETIIDPKGCLSPIESTPVDYLHNRIATECKMENPATEKISVETASGEVIEAEALLTDVRVPPNAKKYTRQNRDAKPDDIPSLYDAVVRGQIRWGSVDFDPVETHRVYDAKGNLVREIFTKWRLNFFSFLDTKPGQDTSFFLNVRSKNIEDTNQNNMKYKKNDSIRLVNEIQISKSEKIEDKTIYTVRIGESKLLLDEQSLAILQRDNKEDTDVNSQSRAYASACVKRKSDGLLGIVTKTIKEQNTEGVDTETVTILTTDQSTYTVDGSKVTWDDNADDAEWVYAEMGDLLAYFITKNESTNQSKTEEEESELDIANARIAELEEAKTRLEKLLKAPEEGGRQRSKNNDTDRAYDMKSDGAEIIDEQETQLDSEYNRILKQNY